MNFSFEENGFLLSDGSHSYLLRLPVLRVIEGLLNSAHCHSLREEWDEGRLSVSFRWQVKDRVFLGEAVLTSHGPGICWQLTVAPEDGRAWQLFHSEEGSGELRGWKEAGDVMLFHGDNVRGVTQDCSLLEGSYLVPIKQWKRPINGGRWQSFPGLWLMEPGWARGFVCGVLSQKIWKYTLHGHVSSASSVQLRGKMTAPGIEGKSFAAGESYHSETLYFEWANAESPAEAFAGYLQALSEGLVLCKTKSLLRRGVSWGSWNDRQPYFWDVSEELIARTIPLLVDRFPSVRALQIDDGYADGGVCEVEADRWTKLEHGLDPDEDAAPIVRARRLGSAFLYEPGHAVATDRFPRGMAALATQITAAGFRPGIWLGLNMIFDALLAQDHPEWMVHCRPGPHTDPELHTVFGGHPSEGFRVLDPSVPEVRDYLEQLAKVLYQEWGFGALKLDFWSYAFEDDSFRLRHSEKSAFEWRSWLFELLRPPEKESFFTIGCDISTGNPFLCPWVDNVRYGIDIGVGRWENIKYSALTGTFLLHVEAYRFYLLNCDSVGLLENLPINEREVFWAWAAATRSLCEVAGDLAHKPRERLRLLQKLLLAPKNGEVAFLGETGHLRENEPAAIVWSRGDLFSTVEKSDHLPEAVLAVFNWTDQERTIKVDATTWGFHCGQIAEADFFKDDCVFRGESRWEVVLPPRSVRLSQISILTVPQPRVLSSTWTIQKVRFEDEDLNMTLNGDSPEGFLIHWPMAESLNLKSSIAAWVESIGQDLFRVLPELAEDSLSEWEVSLKISDIRT